jgi:hypothetical protein
MKYRRRTNGIAMIMSLMILLLLSVLAFSLIQVTNVQYKANDNLHKSQKAYYAARAGLAKARDEIQENIKAYSYGGGSSSVPIKLDDDSKYTYEYWAPPSNGTAAEKVWKITVTGEYDDAKRELTAWAEAVCFSVFGLFCDRGFGVGAQWFLAEGSRYEGRIHNNEFFWVHGKPIITDKITSSNRNSWRYNAAAGTFTGTDGVVRSDRSMFYLARFLDYNNDRIIAGSPRFEYYGGAPEILLPQTIASIKPLANKVYDSDIEIEFISNGTALIKFLTAAGVPTSDLLSTSNLTIYSTQQVTKMFGDIKGRVTVSAADNIAITGNLKYVNKEKDILGILAERNVFIDTPNDVKHNLNIDAVIMAIGKPAPTDDDPYLREDGWFGVKELQGTLKDVRDEQPIFPRGDLVTFGGCILYQKGFTGRDLQFDGSYKYGYKAFNYFDPKLESTTPPNFPIFNSIRIMSIKDSGAI